MVGPRAHHAHAHLRLRVPARVAASEGRQGESMGTLPRCCSRKARPSAAAGLSTHAGWLGHVRFDQPWGCSAHAPGAELSHAGTHRWPWSHKPHNNPGPATGAPIADIQPLQLVQEVHSPLAVEHKCAAAAGAGAARQGWDEGGRSSAAAARASMPPPQRKDCHCKKASQSGHASHPLKLSLSNSLPPLAHSQAGRLTAHPFRSCLRPHPTTHPPRSAAPAQCACPWGCGRGRAVGREGCHAAAGGRRVRSQDRQTSAFGLLAHVLLPGERSLESASGGRERHRPSKAPEQRGTARHD